VNNQTRSSLAVGWCPGHRKLLYANRKIARKAGRKIPGACLSEFQCELTEGSGLWHVGNLPASVRKGNIDRSIINRRTYP
jgi:hypothetical protein